MVLHSFATPADSIFLVGVAQSVGLLEKIDNSNKVNDAKVSLYEDGVLKFELEYVDGGPSVAFNYGVNALAGELIFEEGKEYEIRVEHPTYENISVKQIAPKGIEVTRVKLDENQRPSTDGGLANAVDIEFSDPAGEENYYELKMFRNVVFPDGSGYKENVFLETNDFSATASAYGNSLLLKDDNFDGENYKISVLFWNEPVDLELQWNVITKDYYLYSKSLTDYWNAQDFGFFAEPVSVYTNVENGLGLFGMVNESVYDVEE